MVRSIIQVGHPTLQKKTKKVSDIKSKNIQELVDDLIDTCIANAENTAGLSAPQINKSVSIFVCRRTDLEESIGEGKVPREQLWLPIINPQIISKSKKISIFWEGCLSVGKDKELLFGPVARSDKINLKYLTREGKKEIINAEKFLAHIIQHEIDHLNGRLFIGYISNPENIWKSEELDKYLKKYDEYPEIK